MISSSILSKNSAGGFAASRLQVRSASSAGGKISVCFVNLRLWRKSKGSVSRNSGSGAEWKLV